MPDKGKRKAASSAADGAAPAASGKQREEKERAWLDVKAVKDFLAKIQRPDRLGPNFFTDDERQQWQDYFDQLPLTAAAASDAATLLPVQMPRKLRPASVSPAPPWHLRSWQQRWPARIFTLLAFLPSAGGRLAQACFIIGAR